MLKSGGTRPGLLLLGLAISACPGPPPAVNLQQPEKRVRAKDYSRQLALWTRKTSVMRQFDTTLRAHATLRAPRFEATQIAREAALFKLPAAEREKKLAAARERWKQSIDVVLAVATHDMEWNDLDKKRSHWRVFLRNNKGQQVSPSKIKLQRRITATDRVFFPHLGMFYQLYHVAFPQQLADGSPLIGSDTESLQLQIVGALGNAKLKWKLKR